MLRAFEEQRALTRIVRQRRSAFKLFAGFAQTAELRQKISAHAGQEVRVLQGGLRDLKNLDPTPRRTVESIKEDIQIAKERRS